MCMGGSAPTPVAPAPPPDPIPAPEQPDAGVQSAASNARAKAAAAYGASQTILTGSQGLVTPPTTTGAGKSQLGA